MARRSPTRRALPDRLSLWLTTHLRNVFGAVLIGVGVLLAAWVAVASLPLADQRGHFVQWLGGGAFLVAFAIALAGAMLGSRRLRQALTGNRTVALRSIGSGLALLALWGVAGAITVDASLGGVSLARYGAGGQVGGWLDSPTGWLVIVGGLAVSFVLIAPGLTRRMLAAAEQAIHDWIRQMGREIREKGPLALASMGRGLWAGFVWLLRRLWLLALWLGRELWEAIRLLWVSRSDADPPATPPRQATTVPPQESPAGPAPPSAPAPSAELEEAWPPMTEAEEQPTQPPPETPESTEPAEPPSTLRTLDRTAADGWRLPPIGLLDEDPAMTLRSGAEEQARIIVETLASFGVDASVTQINEGPAITQFGVEPGWEIKTRQVAIKDATGAPVLDEHNRPVVRTEEVSRTRVRVNRITRLADDLALALAAPSIRIEAPVPGQPIVGVEVPNADRRVVALRGLIESEAFAKAAEQGGLPIALGRDVRGNPVIADLTRMPHVLIAGATGSGKSVCINTVISSLLMQKSPEEVRLILVDPKRVELTNYGSAPHLAFSHVVTEPDEVVSVLGVVVAEMDRRYRQLEDNKARNIVAYNELDHVQKRMPYWVVVLDELADMMMAAAAEVEQQLVRLAQLARAVGIHLVVATQRPSVDVVTGLIKANFPTRVAFATTSQTDARVIMDRVGAEKLMGRGDMLYMSSDSIKPRRVQGAYVSDAEIERILEAWSAPTQAQTERSSLDEMLDKLAEESPSAAVEAAARAAQSDLRTLTSTLETALEADANTDPTDPTDPTDLDEPEELPDIVTEALPDDETLFIDPAPADEAELVANSGRAERSEPLDTRLAEATELAREYQRVSPMLLQRRMRIGRPRAERLIDQLEQTGVIEQSDGGRSRRVLSRTK